MPATDRCLPALRRLRLANQNFQQTSHLRHQAARSAYQPLQRRWQHAETSTSAQQYGNEDPPPSRSGLSQNKIKYTSESYPDLKRDSRFKELTNEDVKFFKGVIGQENAVIDGLNQDAESDLEGYNADWMRKYKGQTRLVLKPGSTEQVSKILKYCNDNLIAVNPQGGNTGLVGGSVPVFDEIVINMARMNQIRSFDDVSGILVADAGTIMEAADNFLAEHGHIYPLDLAAKGTCQIGGNVATNAGGLRLLRYGSLHGNVLGLEVVLPDGSIVDDLGKLRKNNTGYDLKQLFIGGEGTIGIITGVSLQCPQRSPAVNVAYFGLSSYEKVQEAFKAAKGRLGEILSAFELMDGGSQQIYKRASGANLPLENDHPFYCLVETSGSNGEHDKVKLDEFLEYVMGEEIVEDGVVAENDTQIANLWSNREGISESSQHFGGVYKYDLSIPLKDLYKVIEDTKQRLAQNNMIGLDDDSKPVVEVIGYGHMGDQNIHLNICMRRYDKEVEKLIEPWVYEWIQKREGSISAEHGLGLAKKEFIGYSRSENMIKLMSQIKKLYDPNGIMNPYKYI